MTWIYSNLLWFNYNLILIMLIMPEIFQKTMHILTANLRILLKIKNVNRRLVWDMDRIFYDLKLTFIKRKTRCCVIIAYFPRCRFQLFLCWNNWFWIFDCAGPVDGMWANWSNWSPCYKTEDGVGTWKTRTRSCSNPVPKHGGKICNGSSTEKLNCTG